VPDLFEIGASASSKLPVTITVYSGPAEVKGASTAGTTIRVTGAGKVILLATQKGNDDFLPAPEVAQSFVVS
jgi:hypothetical protein